MRVAQSLYESGHITYMRTDSVNLSKLALGTISEEIKENIGANYLKVRNYHTNTKARRRLTRPYAPPSSAPTRFRALHKKRNSTT